ncbi:tetratricopeptide repeat protein [Leptothoe sp. PORK10 BA2]|uniref:tetratricopeptide repeat protein n=1 Tax=Leptothoe sp. PORK10 BA2 TaxID=3110254 RepID=UPI002B1EDBBF|nr:tetratricopeptide repeat protein [Leptothoe sp. PORK10 BA2]MEA5465076.1 tetratricopeptide repeat protein [Leptothoe sp. PORK10 BA2]
MTSKFIKEPESSTIDESEWDGDWDKDLEPSVDQEYSALLRSIRWAKGFGLLFLQCSPAEGERLLKRIKKDIGGKRFNRLALDKSVTDLYQLLQAEPDIDQTDVLFITGLEKSLIDYMEPGPERTYTAQDFYAEDKIPRLLGQLNLQREILKETFPLCFVFLVPRYAIKYLVRKAPDFFDWRAGVWEFVSPDAEIQQKSQQILQEGDYEEYLSWSSAQRRERIFEINDLVSEGSLEDEEVASLRFEQGNIYAADGRDEDAIQAYDAALAIKPDKHAALSNKGNSLANMGRYEDAIQAYDAALAIKPDKHEALYNKGISLDNMGRYEDAILAYDAALAIKPDKHEALSNKGNSLANMGRYEDAILAYDAALAIKPDLHEALYNKGNSLANMGRYEDAILAYDAALAIKPDLHEALYGKGISLLSLEFYEEAILSFDQASTYTSPVPEVLILKGFALIGAKKYHEALSNCGEILKAKPDNDYAWIGQGYSYLKLDQLSEAKKSLDKALELNPENTTALESMALYFLLGDNPNQALDYLEKSIQLDQARKAEIADDEDFAPLHHDPRFSDLINPTELS